VLIPLVEGTRQAIDAAKRDKETRADFIRRAIAALVEKELRAKLKPKKQ
jgi:hypothetical protein